MRLSTPCPTCGGPIGVLSFFASLSPWHVRCPACRAPLPLTRREGLWIAAGGATASAAAFLVAKAPFLREGSLVVRIATWVAFAVAADMAACALCVLSCNARRAAGESEPRPPS